MEVTRLAYTGLAVELEHLKIETRLTIEKFASAMGEYGLPCAFFSKLFFFIQAIMTGCIISSIMQPVSGGKLGIHS